MSGEKPSKWERAKAKEKPRGVERARGLGGKGSGGAYAPPGTAEE